MIRASQTLSYIAAVAASVTLGGCAHEVRFHAEYLPEEQRFFVYEGPPSSRTGDYTTLIVPIGNIVQEIARHVFGECFAYGVEVTDSLVGRDDFVLAIEGDMQQFIYSYTKVIDAGFDGQSANAWIVPEVDLAFAVKGYNRAGETVLDKIYDSGVKAGEAYLTTSKPVERINRVLHTTVHDLMLDLVADVRPLLMEECELTELATTRQ